MKRIKVSLNSVLSLILGVMLLAIAVKGNAAQKNTPRYGGTLRVGTFYDIITLNPFMETRSADRYTRSLIFEGLTTFDKDLNLVPGLAQSWEISQDGKTYTFHLRKGVKFHNGKEMTSEDVKWSVDYIMNPKNRAYAAGDYLWVDSLETVDKYTIKFRLKRPDAPFLGTALSIKGLVIVPKDAELSPDSFPPGTGPFEFVEWKPRDHITLNRFKDYWQKGIPYLDTVVLKPITDENVRLTALRAGDLDIALAAPLHLVDALTKGKFGDIRIMPPNGFGLRRLRFNVRRPPFNEAKVRQAFAFALDKKEILSGTSWGHGEVTNQKFRKGSFWHLNVPDRLKDLKKAKELLAEAGYPKGFQTSLIVMHDYLPAALLIKDQLSKVKVTVDVEIMERSAYRARLRKVDYVMTISGGPHPIDPDEIYFEGFYSKFTDSSNASGYVNPALDRLLEEARSIYDPKKRKELYTKALEIIQRDVPEVFLFLEHNYDMSRPYVKNFINNRDDDNLAHFVGGGLAFVWLDK